MFVKKDISTTEMSFFKYCFALYCKCPLFSPIRSSEMQNSENFRSGQGPSFTFDSTTWSVFKRMFFFNQVRKPNVSSKDYQISEKG
jgi:hypothetical protein